MNLILLEAGEINAAGDVRLADARATHLLGVLRVTPGQTVRVGVIDGQRGIATVRAINDDAVDLNCVLEAEAPPRPRLDLLLAVPRPKVMRRLWSQLAASGVFRVILTNAEKVERPYFDTHLLTPPIFRPLLIEGLQQARDTMLPDISIHRRLKVLVEDDLDRLSGPALRLVADPSATSSVGEAVRPRVATDPQTRVLLAIGPEGGWNDFERRLLDTHGFQSVGMGARTLRTDTACIALLALVHDALSGRLSV